MAAREIRSPWSTTDTALAKRDRGDFSVYPIPADQPESDPKASSAQESAESLASPTTSAATSETPAGAAKESELAPPTETRSLPL